MKKQLIIASHKDYYLTKEEGLYVLRQTRFKALYLAGKEHPHDTCAYSRSKEEMRSMVDKYKLGSVDWESEK